MRITETPLAGVLLIHPRIFGDDRGYFFEPYNQARFKELAGLDTLFVQDNESCSKAGVLRGLHFQSQPHAQAKLVRVTRGAVMDVVVDIRSGSPTYGQHYAIRLDATEKLMMYIPPWYAHGFVTLEDDTIFSYKCSAYYHPGSERTILWNDPDLGIDWGVDSPVLSSRDLAGEPFSNGPWYPAV